MPKIVVTLSVDKVDLTHELKRQGYPIPEKMLYDIDYAAEYRAGDLKLISKEYGLEYSFQLVRGKYVESLMKKSGLKNLNLTCIEVSEDPNDHDDFLMKFMGVTGS